jgi:hypothetical protein
LSASAANELRPVIRPYDRLDEQLAAQVGNATVS